MRKKQADAIAEGVSIALAAARLVVKNHILIDTIGEGENFDAGAFYATAKESLETIATESAAAAARIKREQRSAWGKHTISDGTHDYRDRDVRNLRRRRKQSEHVALRLRVMAEDSDAVQALVEASREAAWADVANNLNNRLRVEGMRPEGDPDYARMREARMQALVMIDLQHLEATARSRREAENA